MKGQHLNKLEETTTRSAQKKASLQTYDFLTSMEHKRWHFGECSSSLLSMQLQRMESEAFKHQKGYKRTIKSTLLYSMKERKKVICVWNDKRMSKWWQEWKFWVNYFFNIQYVSSDKPRRDDRAAIITVLYTDSCRKHPNVYLNS